MKKIKVFLDDGDVKEIEVPGNADEYQINKILNDKFKDTWLGYQ